MEVGPHIGAAPAAGRADEPGLKIGQPNVFWPGIGAGRDVMRAVIVAAIDQDTANA